MKGKILILSVLTLTVGALIAYPATADAYRGDPNVKGPNYSAQRHDAMEKAFENKDYNAWKNLMQGRGRVSTVINEKNFAKFAQAHELAEKGKIQEAQNIRQALGLGAQNGSCNGMGRNWNK